MTTAMYMLAVGIWATVAFVRGGTLSGSLAGSLAIGQVLVTVQVLAGVLLLFANLRPPDPTHYLYGATAILTLPFIWSYARAKDPHRALMLYALAALFMFGLAVRGITTGREKAPDFPVPVVVSATPQP